MCNGRYESLRQGLLTNSHCQFRERNVQSITILPFQCPPIWPWIAWSSSGWTVAIRSLTLSQITTFPHAPYSKMAAFLVIFFVYVQISPCYLVLKLEMQKNIFLWTRTQGLMQVNKRILKLFTNGRLIIVCLLVN